MSYVFIFNQTDEIQRVWDNLRALLLVTLNESVKKRLHNVCRRMETFCIMLMGHHYAPVRESAVRLLNSLYISFQ